MLLDNPVGVLPLAGDRALRVAVIGPCADDPQAFFGCYAFPNHVIPQHPEFAGGIGIEADSLLTALRTELPAAEISVPARLRGQRRRRLRARRPRSTAAGAADLVLLAVGDRAGLFGRGTSGEGCDAEDLALPGLQPSWSRRCSPPARRS